MPFEQIAAAVNSVLDPLEAAADRIGEMVKQLEVALERAAGEATVAIKEAEGTVDLFKADIEKLFAKALEWVKDLHLEKVIGEVAGRVQELADLLAKAEMETYFDTAGRGDRHHRRRGRGGTDRLAAGLLKKELEDAARPIRERPRRRRKEIKGKLGIAENGSRAARRAIEGSRRDPEEIWRAPDGGEGSRSAPIP